MRPLLIVWVALLLGACRSESLAFTVVYQSTQCGGLAAGTLLIRDQTELEAALKRGPSVMRTLPQINFDTHLAVLLAMGMKPNSAYGFELTGDAGHVVDDVLILPVKERGPEPGMMYAQVMTSPCMLLTFERVDAVRSAQFSERDQ